MKQYNSNFVTYETTPGIYTIKDIAEAVYPLGDHEGTLKNEYDEVTMKTKLILTHFRLTFGTLRFDEQSFFHTLIKLTPFWDYKPTKAIQQLMLIPRVCILMKKI